MVRINLDETAVGLYQGGGKGNVFVSDRRPKAQPVQRVARSKRRCHLTHVGLICDDSAVQPSLPQVVIGNEHAIKAGELAALRAAMPPNVELLRRPSAWNNSALCVWIINLLAAALAPLADVCQFVLLMDAARIHTTPAVLRACARHGIRLVLIPAKLTWLLQPLDTHAFQRYKAVLRSAYQTARCRSAGAELTMSEFLGCLCSAVRRVLQGTQWALAFDSDGFGDSQGAVTAYIKEHIGATGPIAVPSSRPSNVQLAQCFPGRARVPAALIWQQYAPAPAALALTSGASGSASALPAAPTSAGAVSSSSAASVTVPRALGRLRSETRRMAEAAVATHVGGSSSSAAPLAVAEPVVLGSGGARGSGPYTRSQTRQAAQKGRGKGVDGKCL